MYLDQDLCTCLILNAAKTASTASPAGWAGGENHDKFAPAQPPRLPGRAFLEPRGNGTHIHALVPAHNHAACVRHNKNASYADQTKQHVDKYLTSVGPNQSYFL